MHLQQSLQAGLGVDLRGLGLLVTCADIGRNFLKATYVRFGRTVAAVTKQDRRAQSLSLGGLLIYFIGRRIYDSQSIPSLYSIRSN